MELITIIPAFFIFLYCLYKFIKDDYVFIRKNISLEQLFDMIFGVIWISLFVSRFLSFILNPFPSSNYFLAFFSLQNGGLSLTGAVLGGLLALYGIGKYKKIPLGRLFDFFTLSFLIALPWGYLGLSIFLRKQALFLSVLNAAIYFILTFVFLKLLYPRFMNRTMKEGNLSIIFLTFFSVISLGTSILRQINNQATLLNLHHILLFSLFVSSLLFLLKQEGNTIRGRKGLKK